MSTCPSDSLLIQVLGWRLKAVKSFWCFAFSRGARVFALLLFFAIAPGFARAQSATATLSGTVEDEKGAVITGANITITNVATASRRTTTTNEQGGFTVPLLPPSKYIVRVDRDGFAPLEVPAVVLNVGDQKALQIQLKAGDVNAQVTVDSSAEAIRTDAAVSTVVDRQFVGNLPLSGRSLNALLELTPGVTLAKATPGALGGGQFSINGQRTNANYFMVDGVGANTAIAVTSTGFAGHSASGALPGLTALGSTQSLVSIDALQEFRVQTSSYAPEYGRMPGGQVSLLTRSGTNDYHGTVYEYFRHDALEASDWFVNALRLAKPKLRQSDFGGTFSGPVVLPRFGEGGPSFYSGKDRTFFFFSYEGLRLKLPQATLKNVPSLLLRQQVPAAMQVLLKAYPLPNGRDLGNGLAEFSASYSDPSQFDTTALRVDHAFSSRFTLFGRYSHAPSEADTRSSSLSNITRNVLGNNSFTGGLTSLQSSVLTNELRVNWTHSRGTQIVRFDSFGGAVAPSMEAMFPVPLTSGHPLFIMSMSGTSGVTIGHGADNNQRQFNLVDAQTWTQGSHTLKFGVDYRRVSPILARGTNFNIFRIGPVSNALAGRLSSAQISRQTDEGDIAVFKEYSLYFQDAWRATPRLNLTYGIRWELNPSPTSSNGHQPYTILDLTEPVSFAPKGTPLYQTTYNNFAPRFGAAYVLSERPGWQSLARGGVGIFYDTGFGEAAVAFDAIYPLFATKDLPAGPYPLSPAALQPPVPGDGPPQQFYLMDPHLKLPITYQWNFSVEQSLGASQVLTVSYVGAKGRRLLRFESYGLLFRDFGSTRVPVNFTRNSSKSDYEGLQVQFQRRLSHGLQALANYTFSKSNDTVSDDVASFSTALPGTTIDLTREYGPSDFDVRHVVTAGFTYEIPQPTKHGVGRVLLENWALDGLVRARTAFPVTPTAFVSFPNRGYTVRADVIPGVNQVLTGSQYPGGMRLNPAAFRLPVVGTVGNFPRNSLRGFSAGQLDFTLRREFRFTERTKLQFRFEAFNVFNHPNFADPNPDITGSAFGLSTQMLNRGLGGLSPLYQIGGPRSAQLSLRLLW
jgi:hypothetical protein